MASTVQAQGGESFDFLGKPAGKVANGEHVIVQSLAVGHECIWIAKCPDTNQHMGGG